MTELEKQAFTLVRIELEKAKRKHRVFPGGVYAVSIITEEAGELAQAMNDGDNDDHLLEEAAHVAVTSIRLIERILKEQEKR